MKKVKTAQQDRHQMMVSFNDIGAQILQHFCFGDFITSLFFQNQAVIYLLYDTSMIINF